ncbi:MAG: hypothetical protein IJ168_00685 [Eubacterium sp.]|nr:hypothetical protein [Eubacterium sp.]
MHHITFISNVTSLDGIRQNIPEFSEHSIHFFSLADSPEAILAAAPDTEIIVVDAMGRVGADLIGGLPLLRLIQSEGVGYQGIDLAAARAHGVTVCNNKGVNDTAVAETAVMLMLACLKELTAGSQAVYDGRQIEAKQAAFGVVRELSECTVGLIGFGDIARATAKLLKGFGATVLYTNRTRYEALEEEYGVQYAASDKLLAQADFVSLHVAVCEDTRLMANAAFFSKMKEDAYFINTSRGELVDNAALLQALLAQKLAGAGLDVIAPEPVTADNILLDERIKNKLVLTPHIAGITSLTVKKIYRNIYRNVTAVLQGQTPQNIVSA